MGKSWKAERLDRENATTRIDILAKSQYCVCTLESLLSQIYISSTFGDKKSIMLNSTLLVLLSISNWNRKIQDSKIIQSLTLSSKTNVPRKKKRKSPCSPLLSETKRGNTARFHTNVTCHSILAGRLVYRKPSRFVSRLNWGWERGRKIALNNTGLVHFPWRVSCINLPVAGNAYCWMN